MNDRPFKWSLVLGLQLLPALLCDSGIIISDHRHPLRINWSKYYPSISSGTDVHSYLYLLNTVVSVSSQNWSSHRKVFHCQSVALSYKKELPGPRHDCDTLPPASLIFFTSPFFAPSVSPHSFRLLPCPLQPSMRLNNYQVETTNTLRATTIL